MAIIKDTEPHSDKGLYDRILIYVVKGRYIARIVPPCYKRKLKK